MLFHLRDLIIADEDTLIRSIMNDRVVSVLVSEDQEDVARMIKDYNFLAFLLLIFNNIFLGLLQSMILLTYLKKKHPMTIPNSQQFPI